MVETSCNGETPPGDDTAPDEENPEHDTPDEDVALEYGETPEHREIFEDADTSEY